MKIEHKKLIFALIITAAFLDLLDFSVVNVALPAMRAEFHASLADIQWVIGAYGITMAGLLLLSGRIGDVYGQKRLFVFGVVIFALTSLASGLSPSLSLLILFRAMQGIGAAVSSVSAFALFVELFPEGTERNKAMGIFVAVLSAGFAAGAVVGGLLTTFLGWRYVLFINVPIGLVSAALIQKYLPSDSSRAQEKQLDIPGAVTVTSGNMLFVYALTVASNGNPLSLSVLAPLGLAVLILAAFVFIESRSKAPLVPLGFLRRGSVFNANVIALLTGAASGGIGLILTVYMQQILGYSPLVAGLGFLPPALIFFVVGGWGTSWFMEKLGTRKVLLLGTLLITFGVALLTQISLYGGYLSILPGSLLWALGASIGFPAIALAALAGTKPGEEGLASGLITTSQRMGFPLGLAILVTISSFVTPSTTTVTSAATIAGFRYAFAAAMLMGILSFVIALRIKAEKRPARFDETKEGIGAEFERAGVA